MFLLMFIGLYSSRVTLQVLGADDFGIYNVVGGIVVLFLFFNSALTAGVQRYLNFYLGNNDTSSLKKIFSQSVRVFIILSIIIFVLSESIGILLLEKYMVIPSERMNAARIIYQLSIISTLFMMMKIPFNAVIISYEKMSFFAATSLLEGLLKLAGVIILKFIPMDKLILYAIFTLSVSIIMFLIFVFYCKHNFEIINFKKYNDKTLLKGILSFSGWNILGSAAGALCNQGINIVINRFFGVALNAAMGVANQINNAIYGFLSNFQTAFNPQIVKSYAQDDKEYLFDFVNKTSKYSFFLLYFIILPFLVNREFVMKLWLHEVPEYATTFVIHLCIFTLIDSLSGPLWMLAEAEGNIKTYQIVGGLTGLAVLPFTYLAFKLGLPSYSGLIVHNIQLVCFAIWRLFYLRKRVDFPVFEYFKKVYLPLFVIVPISFFSTYYVHKILSGLTQFFVSCVFSCIILSVLYIFIGTNKSERKSLFNIIRRKLHKNENH